MRLAYKIIHGLFIVSILIACEKDGKDILVQEGLENLEFTCYDSSSIYFVRGVLNEDSICLYNRANDCFANFGQEVGFVTLSPTFIYGEVLHQKSYTRVDIDMQRFVGIYGYNTIDEIRITTPPLNFGPSLDSMVRAFLTPGLHSFRSKINDDSISVDGFELLMNRFYYNPNHKPNKTVISFSSALGDQSGSFVDILQIELNEENSHVEGFIHLKFKCKMYLVNTHFTGDYYGDFSGEFNMPISYNL